MNTLNLDQYRQYELPLAIVTIILIILGYEKLAIFTGFIPAYYLLQSLICPVR